MVFYGSMISDGSLMVYVGFVMVCDGSMVVYGGLDWLMMVL